MLPLLGMAGGGGLSAKTEQNQKTSLDSTNTFGPVSFGSKNVGTGLDWKILAIGGVVILVGVWLWTRK